MSQPRVAVVGVGGLGAAVADALAARGADVVAFERFAIPHERGSSFGETRVIRNGYFESPRYVPLLQRAWTLWRALSRSVGDAQTASSAAGPLLVETGVLHVGPPEHAAMRALLESVHAHALPHEIIDRARVSSFGITPGPDDVGVREDQGGFLYVERCTRAFVARARARGARILEQMQVVGIDARADSVEVHAVRADGGRAEERVRADHVIVCGGAWSAHDPALTPHFARVPLVVTRQPQLWFAAPDASHDVTLPPAFIHFVKAREDGGAFYGIPPARPNGPMKVCLHHAGPRVAPDDVVRTITDADCDAVRDYVRAHLPQLGPLAEARICMYTSTPDEHFVIGPSHVDARVTLASACSGHGYKMTIVLAEALTQLVMDGHTPHDLALFSPARFASATA